MIDMTGRHFARRLLTAAAVVPTIAVMDATAQDKPVVTGGTLNMIVQPEPPSLMLGLSQLGPTQFAAGKIYQVAPDLRTGPEAVAVARPLVDHLP